MITGPFAFAFDIPLGVAKSYIPNYVCHISLHFLKGMSKFKVSRDALIKAPYESNMFL